MSYTLYTHPTPNPLKVLIVLEELGVSYKTIFVDFGTDEQKSPEFLKLNPNGRIPLLIDHDADDFAIIESGAILHYLAEKHQQLQPTDTKGKSEVMQWLMWQMGGLGPMFGQLIVFAAAFDNRIPEATDRYGKETGRLLSVLNTRLEGRDFLASSYSIADIASMAWMPLVERVGWDLADWPNVKAWYDRCMSRPAYTKAIEAAGTLPEEVRMSNFRNATVGLGS
ncbi:MAG: glutathione S-transferase family protein [Sneathiella sp.]|nr:glutathione S-transferase family protein [Sneathiella sp.]